MKSTLHSGRNPTWSRYVSPGCLDPALPGLSTFHSHSMWSQWLRKENCMVGGEEPPACSRAAAWLESLPGQALIFPRPPPRSPPAPSSAHRGTGPSPFLYGQHIGCLSRSGGDRPSLPSTSQWPREPVCCLPTAWMVAGAGPTGGRLRGLELGAPATAAVILVGTEAEAQKQEARALTGCCDHRTCTRRTL